MSAVRFPEGFLLEHLCKSHPRKAFRSGQSQVDDWLATKALQQQEKHLSTTKVLIDSAGLVVGYYTLATGQVDFTELPDEEVRKLPRRQLPVAILAWLGISKECHGKGLGRLLLAQALCDCYNAGQTFAFIAVILDCIDDNAKSFYQHYDFAELPGHPYRLFLSFRKLSVMMSNFR